MLNDRKLWSQFLLAHAPRSGAFLHSAAWSDAESVGVFDADQLVAIAALSRTRLPLGLSYLSCMRGPVFRNGRYDGRVMKALATYGQGALFLRCEPAVSDGSFERSKEMRVSVHASPAHTLILSLAPSDATLLAAMHSKTRYNIRVAEKKGVTVEFAGRERFDEVWPLFQATATRDRFRLHTKAHYENQLERQGVDAPRVFLAIARLEGQALAANIMVDFAGTRTYLHGASGNEARNVMAPHLLHWRLIEDAKKQGLLFYDWWGIAGTDDPNDPWAGITRFKKGFGGEEVAYPGTFDLILDSGRYSLYTAARQLARRLRGRS